MVLGVCRTQAATDARHRGELKMIQQQHDRQMQSVTDSIHNRHRTAAVFERGQYRGHENLVARTYELIVFCRILFIGRGNTQTGSPFAKHDRRSHGE